MAPYGSGPWLEVHRTLCEELPEVVGATVRAEVAVSDAPGGEVRYTLAFTDGRLSSSMAGSDPDAEVAITLPYAHALAVLDGELDANVAYMRGDLKSTGHTGRLLRLLALQRTEPYRAVLAGLAGQTDR